MYFGYNVLVMGEYIIDIRKIELGGGIDILMDVFVPICPSFGASHIELEVSGRLVKTDKGFALNGHAKGVAVLDCALCIKPVDYPFDFDVIEDFTKDGDDEGEAIGFSGTSIDILPAIKRNLIINMPMKVLCTPDCKGLCHKCAKDQNQGECDCKKEINEQFRDILDFFNKVQ